MNIIFENKYEMTNKIISEFSFNYYLKFNKPFFLISILMVAFSIYYSIVNHYLGISIVFISVIIIYLIWLIIGSVLGRFQYNKNHKNKTVCIQINDEYRLVASPNGFIETHDIYHICPVKTTKNLIFIRIKRKSWLILKKDAFTIGTYNDFDEYIKKSINKIIDANFTESGEFIDLGNK